MFRNIVAIEGLVHAGKSTLLKMLSERNYNIACIGEYIDFAECEFPDFPKNINDSCSAKIFFLNLEKKRMNHIVVDKIIVLDRSVFSILAYDYAVESITNRKILSFTQSIKYFSTKDWIMPNYCIYLNIDDHEINMRHKTEKGNYKSIFLDNNFNFFLRKFYEEILLDFFPEVRFVKIDAQKKPNVVFSEAEMFLKNIVE